MTHQAQDRISTTRHPLPLAHLRSRFATDDLAECTRDDGCWQSGQHTVGDVARAVITIWFSVLVICSTQNPGSSGKKAIGDTGRDSFLQEGNSGEACSPFIIAHSLAQEMRESRKKGSLLKKVSLLASTARRSL